MPLSSCPIAACVDRFSYYPKLKLQDLTHSDIEKYVSDTLGNHELLRDMEVLDPGVIERLVILISTRAEGVFPWVILIVKRVEFSLQQYDSAAELVEQINKLPRDLEELYNHILNSIQHKHRLEASRFIQLVLRNSEIILGYPMTILQLSYACDECHTTSLDTQINPLSETVASLLCKKTEGRLRGRCCGMIEFQDPVIMDDTKSGAYTVGFLHRTVAEFLQTSYMVWSPIASLISGEGSDFNTDLVLLGSSLYELKSLREATFVNPKDTSSIIERLASMLAFF
ncbi:hypothetical protein CHU98_g12156 [Xylaria longipes]|nr:hypothetical protein CHU98_g12156 [Xylaria longipes]